MRSINRRQRAKKSARLFILVLALMALSSCSWFESTKSPVIPPRVFRRSLPGIVVCPTVKSI